MRNPKKLLWPLGITVILLTTVAAVLILAGHFATQRAVDKEAARVKTASILLVSSFRNELKRFRLALRVLDGDPDLAAALLNPDFAHLDALNRKFEGLTRYMDGATVYLIDAKGLTLASSNWRSSRSFVGHNYAFRPYHRLAMQKAEHEQFALGTISGKPGLHIARRIDSNGRSLGVIVIKVLFEALEEEWRQSGTIAFATDQRGIILVTSQPQWRFQTTAKLPDVQRLAIRATPDFGGAPMNVNRLFATGAVAFAGTRDTYIRPFVDAVETLPDGWTIHALAFTQAAVRSAKREARLGVTAALLLTAALLAILYFRRRSTKARADLATSERLRLLNEQLMQTNRLATLGQIAAGVGHEINQPLAAIAAYADNGNKLIVSGNVAGAVENMNGIVALTDRIGKITGELRGFARQSSEEIGPIPVERAISGALLLLRDRITTLKARVDFLPDTEAHFAMAERVRLEQVFVNLLQNALDAGGLGVLIRIGVEQQNRMVVVTVSDSGPGLPDSVRASLFQPFSTSKPQGLGLGLVISRDIMADFGGELVANHPDVGAEFLVRLRAYP